MTTAHRLFIAHKATASIGARPPGGRGRESRWAEPRAEGGTGGGWGEGGGVLRD